MNNTVQEYHRDLFRQDRRPHAQRSQGRSRAHGDKGHGRPKGRRNQQSGKARSNAFVAPDHPFEPGCGQAPGAGVTVVRSAWGHQFVVFEAPAPVAPALTAAAAALK